MRLGERRGIIGFQAAASHSPVNVQMSGSSSPAGAKASDQTFRPAEGILAPHLIRASSASAAMWPNMIHGVLAMTRSNSARAESVLPLSSAAMPRA